MKTNKVLEALADRIQAYFQENPEVAEAMAEQAKALQNICSVALRPDMKRASDRMTLLSGINNLN